MWTVWTMPCGKGTISKEQIRGIMRRQVEALSLRNSYQWHYKRNSEPTSQHKRLFPRLRSKLVSSDDLQDMTHTLEIFSRRLKKLQHRYPTKIYQGLRLFRFYLVWEYYNVWWGLQSISHCSGNVKAHNMMTSVSEFSGVCRERIVTNDLIKWRKMDENEEARWLWLSYGILRVRGKKKKGNKGKSMQMIEHKLRRKWWRDYEKKAIS